MGSLTLYLPLEMAPETVQGRTAYWIRCRFEPRRPEQGRYAQSPRIRRLQAHTLGGTVRATHAVVYEDERLGVSNGEPGQLYYLEHTPVLTPEPGETVEVEEFHAGEVVFVPWTRVEDFATSTRYDRHFTLDEASGEIAFGPSVRQADGTVRQYGRVPETGRAIRFTSYRQGGGARGNVPAGNLQILRTSPAYIDHVINLRRAEGGRDQESLEEAKLRARREMRAQQRAVTAEDFENLARRATRAVARVKCRAPGVVGEALPPGMIELLVVPSAFEALRAGDVTRLALEPSLREELIAYLDRYRLLTTTLRVRAPRYLGVAVTAEVVPGDYSHPETVRARVVERLHRFITPLTLGDDERLSEMMGHPWQGWPFGRDLYVSEIFSMIQQVPGVQHVLDVQIAYRPVVPIEETQPVIEPTEETEEMEESHPTAMVPLEGRLLAVPDDTLLCSLQHAIEVVQL
jgi:predicted phage baseplate assembly protein